MERPGRLLSTLALVVAVLGHGGLSDGAAETAGARSSSPSDPAGSVLAPLPLPAPLPEVATGPLPGEGTTVVATTVDPAGRPTFHPVTAATLEQAQELAAQVEGAIAVEVDPIVRIASGDPYRSTQWGHDALGIDALPAGGDGMVVAVVDSGIAAWHEDLNGQVLCSLGIDYVDDGASTDGCADPNGHGTHVAGIVAAITGNDLGLAGAAPAVKVLPVRALDSTGAGYASDVAAGIVHAVDKGADVINLSLSGNLSSAQQSAVDYAVSHDVVVVAAAGNNRQTGNAIQYPAAFPAVLSVAATTKDGISASFSYSGPTVDVAAPGVSISSTLRDGSYGYKSGTSMAAPAVAALAARYRSARPDASQADVVAALTGTARDLEAPGRDDNTGTGLVDLAAALAASATPAAPSLVAPAAPAAPTATAADSAVSLSWSAVASSTAAPVSGYRLYRDDALLAQTPALNHVDNTVSNGTGYAYSVSAYGDGGESPRSTATTATPAARPAAPAGLVAAAGDRTVSLSWEPSTGGGPVLGYRVYRNGLHHLTSTGASATDTVDVVNGTTYTYSIRAYGSGGESPDSPAVLATPVAPAPSGGGGGGSGLAAPAPTASPSPLPSPTASPSPAPAPSSPAPETVAPAPGPAPALEEPAPAPEPLVGFPDALSSVHAASIEKVARAGITTGYPDGTFRPDQQVTRAQMATFLVRALGLEPVPGTRFPDAAGNAHEAAINAVAAAGITVGDGRGGFAPAAAVTRGQLATFLTRALSLPPSEVGSFSDIAGHTHEPAIRAVAAAGIAQGDSSGRFVPEAQVTRAQMATFLARALGL